MNENATTKILRQTTKASSQSKKTQKSQTSAFARPAVDRVQVRRIQVHTQQPQPRPKPSNQPHNRFLKEASLLLRFFTAFCAPQKKVAKPFSFQDDLHSSIFFQQSILSSSCRHAALINNNGNNNVVKAASKQQVCISLDRTRLAVILGELHSTVKNREFCSWAQSHRRGQSKIIY